MLTYLLAGSSRGLRLLGALALSANCGIAEVEPGFQPIFDGRSLMGWEAGDPVYWSVEEGAITGRITQERPCTTNQYLVWRGGELADFELKMESRLDGEGGVNGGFQFRSRLMPDYDVCGYQVDNNLRTPWLVRLYDEYGRHDLALHGQRTVFATDGSRTVSGLEPVNGGPTFRLEDWHEYHLTCDGPRISLRVNGQLVAEVTDHDPRRAESQGILALQLHSGPPTVTQFRNIRLKILKPAATKAAPVSADEYRARFFHDALAWWPLDVGGHGAIPPLACVPQFYQLELNVRPDGPGATPGAKVMLLDGAYLNGGTNLNVPGDQLTVWFRARDPRGLWNSALFAKRGGDDRVHFNLFGDDLPDTPGPDIGFEVQTTSGLVRTSFPISQIDAKAWHDLAGRYDGETIAIFCDGRRMAGKPARGVLVPNAEPLLIGAQRADGKAARHFVGEIEAVAIWPRALTDHELAAPGAP